MNLPFDNDDYELLSPRQRDIDVGLYTWNLQKWTHMYAIDQCNFDHWYNYNTDVSLQVLYTYTDVVLCFCNIREHNNAGRQIIGQNHALLHSANFVATLHQMRGKDVVKIIKDRTMPTLDFNQQQEHFHTLLMEWTAPCTSTTINSGDVRPNPSNRIS